jgi:hypothetical protein
MFQVKHEITKRRVFVKLAGFIQLPEMIQYGNQLTELLNKIPYKVFLLVDALENKVLQQETISEFNSIRERNKSNLLKSAVIIDNEVLTKETERTYKQVNVEWEEQYFKTIAEAEKWLNSFKDLNFIK